MRRIKYQTGGTNPYQLNYQFNPVQQNVGLSSTQQALMYGYQNPQLPAQLQQTQNLQLQNPTAQSPMQTPQQPAPSMAFNPGSVQAAAGLAQPVAQIVGGEAGGAISGAASGAAAGAALGPVGAIAGGVLGLAGSIIGSRRRKRQERRARKAAEKKQRQDTYRQERLQALEPAQQYSPTFAYGGNVFQYPQGKMLRGSEEIGMNYANGGSYKIKSGDTLSKIAKKTGVSMEDIIRANNIQNPNLIIAGKTLTIPGMEPTAPSRAALYESISPEPGVQKLIQKLSDTPASKLNNKELNKLINDAKKQAKKEEKEVKGAKEDIRNASAKVRDAVHKLGVPLQATALIYDLLGGKGAYTEKSLTDEELKSLKEAAKRSDRGAIEYADYATTGEGSQYGDVGGGASSAEILEKLSDPAYGLKTTLGQARVQTTAEGDTTIVDEYDFNNRVREANLQRYLQEARAKGADLYGQARLLGKHFGSAPGEGAPVNIDLSTLPDMAYGGGLMDPFMTEEYAFGGYTDPNRLHGSSVDHAMGGGLSRGKDYGSKKKPYPKVKSGDFAGGGRSYPIPTKADAVDALRLAGLHGRSDVKTKVYKKYPGLKKKAYGGSLHPYDEGKMMKQMLAYGGKNAYFEDMDMRTMVGDGSFKGYGGDLATGGNSEGMMMTGRGMNAYGDYAKGGKMPYYRPSRRAIPDYYPTDDTYGMKEQDPANFTEFQTGGTHEQNPNGGVPLGPKALVEQGEVKYDSEKFGSYIFSNRF